MQPVRPPSVHLDDPVLRVSSGSRPTTRLVVKNVSGIVGEYEIFVPTNCEVRSWISFRQIPRPFGSPGAPISISFLRAGQEVELEIAVTPPTHGRERSGSIPYVIAIEAKDDQHESTSIEGVIEVSGKPRLDAKLLSPKVRGRKVGRLRIGVANTGSEPLTVRLTSDADVERTSVSWSPRTIRLEPHTRDEFLVSVRSRALKPVGKKESHPATFVANGTSDDGETVESGSMAAVFEHQPVVPTVALALPVAAVAGLGYLVMNRGRGGSVVGDAGSAPAADGGRRCR